MDLQVLFMLLKARRLTSVVDYLVLVLHESAAFFSSNIGVLLKPVDLRMCLRLLFLT